MECTGTYQEYMSSTLTSTPPSLGNHCWQSSLEEPLLSLGQFEEAHDELWAWLVDSLQQLMEPISGDPVAVTAQLSNPKVKIVEMSVFCFFARSLRYLWQPISKELHLEIGCHKNTDIKRSCSSPCSYSLSFSFSLSPLYLCLSPFWLYLTTLALSGSTSPFLPPVLPSPLSSHLPFSSLLSPLFPFFPFPCSLPWFSSFPPPPSIFPPFFPTLLPYPRCYPPPICSLSRLSRSSYSCSSVTECSHESREDPLS